MPVNGWRNLDQRSLTQPQPTRTLSAPDGVKEHEALTGTPLHILSNVCTWSSLLVQVGGTNRAPRTMMATPTPQDLTVVRFL
jgi:hypothetical protein